MLQAQNIGKSGVISLIAVGSNLPSPAGSVSQTVTIALELLEACESIHVLQKSRLFQTPAYPKGSGPDFINAAVRIKTDLSPPELLKKLHAIEAQMGRTRTNRWEARVLDMDVLAIGDLILPDLTGFDHWMNMPEAEHASQAPEQLILPHPRMHERSFVLVPLADIAPDWKHPRRGETVRQMLGRLPPRDLEAIKPLAPPDVPPGVREK